MSCFHKFQVLSKRQLLVIQLWNVPLGFFSPSHSRQVQWLFNFYVCGVHEASQTLISSLISSDFHFTSPPQRLLSDWTGNLWHIQRRSHCGTQLKAILFAAVWHASFIHPVWYASVLSLKCGGCYLRGMVVFPMIKQHMKQYLFIWL